MLPMLDWDRFFKPAVLALLNGGDPYAFAVFNPPWAFAPLIPFAVLPDPWGKDLLLLVSAAAMGWTAYRLGDNLFSAIAVLLSPLVLNALVWGNVEWLALLGLAVSPGVGLVLLAIKPQITFAAMLLILWRERQQPRVLLPVLLIGAASVLWMGPYPLRVIAYGDYAAPFNTSLFPFTVPLGLFLLWQTLRRGKMGAALAAAPMLAPTLSQTAWAGLTMALAEYPTIALLTTAALWAVVFATGSLWFFR